MDIVPLMVFLELFGNLFATHCDKELDYHSNYGYGLDITCEGLSNQSEQMLKELIVSNEIVLNISNSNLTRVSHDFFDNVHNIKYLFITNSTFSFDPSEHLFSAFKKLEHLTIENTVFNNLNSQVMGGLDSLKKLNLLNCSLDFISKDTFKDMKNLETLRLSRNHFKSLLDIPFCELPTVKYVDLNHNEIREIEDKFVLCLESQKDSVLLLNGEDFPVRYHSEEFFTQAKSTLNLIHMNLSHNKITRIDHLEWGMSLKYLDLSNNELKNISKNLFNAAKQLERLNLQNNLIEEIHPVAFFGLENLSHVNLENNRLSEVTFENLINLKEVKLSKNQLVARGLTQLKNLTKLQKLFLKDNQIEELPLNIFENCTSLQLLDLSNNKILLNNKAFKGFGNLRQLSLRNNSLEELPNFFFSNLSALEVLDISSNKIRAMTNLDTFYGLENLQILNVSNNLLESLRDELLKPLRSLQVLDISGNRLQNFRVSLISQSPSLRVINIRSNLLPCSILATIIAFLKSQNISYSINEKFEYEKENIEGIYCEEMSNRILNSEKKDSEEKKGQVFPALLILFIVVVSSALFSYTFYKCFLYTRRRKYRMDEVELL